MSSLIIHNKQQLAEFPLSILPSEIPFEIGKSNTFKAETPLADQLSLDSGLVHNLCPKTKVFIIDSLPKSYSIIGVNPVRIGSMPSDHIKLKDTSACLAIYENTLNVIDDSYTYLNGKKIFRGDYQLYIGDCIWVGCTKIVVNENYVECSGISFTCSLNISTITPEPYGEFPIYKRSPRIIKRAPTDSVDIDPPKPKEEKRKNALLRIILPPLMSSAVMVGGSLLIGRGLFILIGAAAMFVSVVFSATMFISDRKDRNRKEKERDDKYDRYLLEKRKKINELYEMQRESLLYHNLSPKEIEREILFYSSRIYERSANDSDFLTLSLGYSTVSSSYDIKYKSDSENEDELAKEMKLVGDFYLNIKDMPTVIDLKNSHLGLVGEKTYIHRQLSSILTQLCFFQSYHDIEVILLVESEYCKNFEWIRWYPHCKIKNINVTSLVSAENQRDQVLGNVAQVLKMRKQKQVEEKKDAKYLPHYIFIIDNPKLIINHSIMEYLQTDDTKLGFSIIYTTHIQANLPENIKTVLLLTGGDQGILVMNEGDLLNRYVTTPTIHGINLDIMSRKLSPLIHTQGVSTQIPESITFFELYNVKRPEEIPVLDLWRKNACHKSLAVPLGLRGKDDIVLLNLHEKAHGPHGLVAGTTGSGKSEIVQSYILSLAVNFHPHEVGFLLIDYKGGGMANLFSKLPHLLGTITNLDGSESMRALASIKSELARRQRIFNDNGVNNINQYTKLFKSGEATLPLPHLFIISDEFAELKKEQPDFMSELVSTARIGRSLGVHLILATQKPSGVVDDQIWSNSKFKLALKVANENDSNEVLKTPDAARITLPGRSYLQVGNNEIYELFQSAWSGAPYSEEVVEKGFDGRVYLINQLGQGVLLNDDLSVVDKSEDTKITQLDAVVNHVNELFESLNVDTVERPWLPPLDNKIVSKSISLGIDVGKISTYNLTAPLGMVDIPEDQCQVEYSHNFLEDGNLAIFGSPGFGKSTTLMNITLSLVANNSPSLINYFILDYGNSALAQLRGLPHTADYIGFDDMEKLGKLIKLLTDELKQRKHLLASVNAINFRMYNDVSSKKIPAILVFIDNADVVREISQELEDFLIKMTRDGTGVGIYTIITASRPGAVRYSVLNNFKNKIAQFMFDTADISSVVGRSPYTLPEVRGRALIKLKDVHVAQCYLPVVFEDEIGYSKLIGEVVDNIATSNTAPKAKGVRMVSDLVTYKELLDYTRQKEHMAIIGFDIETTEPAYMDLSITNQLIVGSPITGKTNILKLILTQFEGHKIFLSDSRAQDLQDYENKENITYVSTESQFEEFYNALLETTEIREQQFKESGLRIRDFCAKQPQSLVIIDDGDNFIEISKSKAMEIEKLIPRAMEIGITFITSTTPIKMRGYDTLTKILKADQSGLLLGNPSEQSFLPVKGSQAYKPIPDIGFTFKRGDVRQVKIPFIK